ncbi:MAG TPA: serine hydrolase [Xanthomonadaceae bacterium]|jgi:CubicO group peptidase (beta-lactamase class C family)|nr:serine hydrolase [Xanthomonadaceae bacterium]
MLEPLHTTGTRMLANSRFNPLSTRTLFRFTAFLLALLTQATALAAQTDRQRVDQIFAAYDKPGSPGCALGVIRNGDFVYRKGYGEGSLELGVPLSSQSVLYMGSVSKQFTAASVVLAAEQGFLSLDDDVRKYIPELPDYGKPITLREMLHHTSGLREYETLEVLSGRSDLDVRPTSELIDLIARQKALNFQPGAEYQYSNTNYFLLAEVVKRATRKPLPIFAAENIFHPLGMAHTLFYDDRSVVVPGRVPAYDAGANGTFVVDWSTNFDRVGAGGLLSSVDDLLLWDRNFDDNHLGTGTLIKEMETRGVLNDGTQIPYMLGLTEGTWRGLPVIEHSGGHFGYVTELLRFPQQHFTVTCLCNVASADPETLARSVAAVYLKDLLQAPDVLKQSPGTDFASDPAGFAGTYQNPRSHSIRSVAVAGGSLTVGSTAYDRVGPNAFRTSGPEGSAAVFEGSGKDEKLTISNDGEIWFTGSRIDVPGIDETALADYAGTYASAELNATYRIAVENGNLTLQANGNSALELKPGARDEFVSGWTPAVGYIAVVFRRSGNGRISGLALFSAGVRNLDFEKNNRDGTIAHH